MDLSLLRAKGVILWFISKITPQSLTYLEVGPGWKRYVTGSMT